MSETDRFFRHQQQFSLDPSAVLNDPAWLAMTPLAQRAYMVLLLKLWTLPEPGVSRDNDRVLSRLVEVSEPEWPVMRDEVIAALDCTSRPGHVISPLVVAAHDRWIKARDGERARDAADQARKDAEKQRDEARSEIARLAASCRWAKRKGGRPCASNAQAMREHNPVGDNPVGAKPPANGDLGGSVIGLGVTESDKAKDSDKSKASREQDSVPDSEREKIKKRWLDRFEEFWDSKLYPHYGGRSTRRDAEDEWMKLLAKFKIRDQETADSLFSQIMTSVTKYRESSEARRDGGKWVPAVHRWIKRCGWEACFETTALTDPDAYVDPYGPNAGKTPQGYLDHVARQRANGEAH